MPRNTRDYLTLGMLTLVVVASGFDLVSDVGHGASALHLFIESVVLALALVLLGWILLDLRRQALRIADLEHQLEQARAPQRPRSPELEDARKRFRDAVNHQFDAWELTESEREVGWLLLKGLSVKEIAAARSTHEKTSRHQASSIYRKAGLPGRHGFAAWFIEDLI